MRFSSHSRQLAAVLALLVTACQSKPADPPATAATELPATPAAPTSDAGTWYRQYRGLLPGTTDSVTLHVQQLRSAFSTATPDNRLSGFYTLADGLPYELLGVPSGQADSLRLRYTGTYPVPPAGAAATGTDPEWELIIEANQLVGTRNGQPVRLRLLRQSGVQFAARHFAANVLPRPNHPEDSIAGTCVLRALVPLGSTLSAAALAASIRQGLRGDTLAPATVPPLDSLWQQQLRRFSRGYREEVAPMLAPQPTDPDDYRPSESLGYSEEASVYVLWNEGNLLSLGYFSYEFSGGAHGNYGTAVRSYDTRTGRWLNYDAIFRSGAGPRLEKLLGRYLRTTLSLPASAPLFESLLVDSVPVTRNVYLTSGGAIFVYQPYEIAAFSYGEISVFVPFAELNGLLQPGLPVGATGPAVARR